MAPPSYKLMLPDETAGLIRNLHPHLKKKIKAALQAIISDPFVGKALKDELKGLLSFRVSSFRIVYRVAPKRHIIEIMTIGPRKHLYEETFRLMSKKD